MSMVTCPTCNGKKEITVDVHEAGKTSSFKMDCHACRGKGEVTRSVLNALDKARKAWCSCGNVSTQVRFYDDNEHPECRKHHWRCGDCGKILQVG